MRFHNINDCDDFFRQEIEFIWKKFPDVMFCMLDMWEVDLSEGGEDCII